MKNAVTMDLATGSPEMLTQALTASIGATTDDILLIWNSQPCETMSRADITLTNRGCHSRDWSNPERPPKSQDHKDPKVARALLHDTFLPRFQQMIAADHWRGHKYAFITENPGGSAASLWRRPYAQQQCWPANLAPTVHLETVELCAYNHPLKKTTGICCGGEVMLGYKPAGLTGDGRCHGKCPQGGISPLTGKWRHPYAAGEDPSRMPKGPGAKELIHSMPSRLHEEVLRVALGNSKPRQRIVIDLFAGHRSLFDACQRMGLIYIPVDITFRERKAKRSVKGTYTA